MGGSPVTPKVLALLTEQFAGKVVTVDQIVVKTGLTGQQVRASMRQLASREDLKVDVIQRGQTWRFDYAKAVEDGPADTLFEVVGTSAKDEVIVRGDATKRLFKVVAI